MCTYCMFAEANRVMDGLTEIREFSELEPGSRLGANLELVKTPGADS